VAILLSLAFGDEKMLFEETQKLEGRVKLSPEKKYNTILTEIITSDIIIGIEVKLCR